jgi:hypothetical protein
VSPPEACPSAGTLHAADVWPAPSFSEFPTAHFVPDPRLVRSVDTPAGVPLFGGSARSALPGYATSLVEERVVLSGVVASADLSDDAPGSLKPGRRSRRQMTEEAMRRKIADMEAKQLSAL